MGDERSRSAARGSQSLPGPWLVAAAIAAAAAGGCGDSPPGRTFYQRNIEPILQQKCAGNTSGCHSTNPGDPFQFAAGNFDVTSFANVQKRRDLLVSFGAYAYPPLLIKAVPPGALALYYDTKVPSIDPKVSPSRPLEVLHSGGPILDVNSDAFIALRNWLDNGATENGLKPPTPPQVGNGSCSDSIPSGFSKATYVTPMTQASFDAFRMTVQPILTKHGCVAGNCHGAPQSDFYITCGASDDELAFNFSQAWSFVNTPVEDSQILRVPLAANAGGRGHTGGDQFAGPDDADYKTIRAWAMQAGLLDFAGTDAGKKFFASYVQPILLARGCSFQACHSPAATNDFKLRSGTQGFFSAVALEKNYELLRNEFMAIEFPDPRRSRAVAKALISNGDTASGIAHRGGPVLEDPAHPAACTIDPTRPLLNPQDFSPLCIIQAWLTLERSLVPGKVTPMNLNDPATIVYVQRSTAMLDGDPLAFDTFAGGAELRRGDSTFDTGQQIKLPIATSAISLTGCGALAGGDIRGPDVAPDGDHVVFAARGAATDPLQVYMLRLGDPANSCVHVTMPNGAGKIHNFDPAFSPDGKWIVFASTRGKPSIGPTQSRKRFLPQSDLWRVAVNGDTVDQGSYEQITYLSNSEVSPHFMREGRITMTTEKASDGFYQLSGRRINWDRTDYHPLLAQRATSPYASLTDLTQTKPSIGYASATQIREGSDGSFLVILSDLKPDGTPVAPGRGGALGVFNRSIGPFEQDRMDTGYIPALRIVGATATGRAGSAASYRSPVSLPSGDIMASYADTASAGNFAIVSVNPHGGPPKTLIAAPGSALVDAVLVYKYPPRTLYENRRQLVFGGGSDTGDPAHAVLHMPDAPMVFTLLTGNLRRGRPVEAFRKAKFLAIYSEGLCPAGTSCTANTNGIYQSRSLLGRAQLADDGSVRVQVPSATGVVLELQDDKQNSVVKMSEEHQLGPGEQISMGIVEPLFDAVCAGCHGSVTGHEVDVRVTPDALTGASASMSATQAPVSIP